MKITTKTGLAVFLVFAVISCTKENNTIRSSAVTQSSGKALTFTIGEHYGGGIIFYIDSTGQHGLIADTSDLSLSPVRWYNGNYTLTKAMATAIGKGRSNTRKIIQSQGATGSYAALACSQYKGSGYKDWYMPSKDELNLLYLQKNLIGGFVSDFYWSSSEYQSRYAYLAWRQSFATGLQGSELKYAIYHVRAIRAF